jgi:hypothetical protein
LWLIKVWLSASTFVVKIAIFAKPETVMGDDFWFEQFCFQIEVITKFEAGAILLFA